ncbi:MAG: DNA polymerase III subunit alpha [Mariprofundales bacterium]
MRFSRFVHLHVHSDYSLLGASASIGGILGTVAKLRQPAVALTDYANLFGAIDFYSNAMRRGIKPIMGMEVYLCPDHRQKISSSRMPQYPTLLLLARTNIGWRNLMALASIGYLQGFYYKPRIDKNILAEHIDGLIGLSSGWNGEVERALRAGKTDAGRSLAIEYASLFRQHDQPCFFLELQRHGSREQDELSHQVLTLAHATDIPLVATNATHFVERADFQAFETVLALQQNRTLNDNVSRHFTPEHYLKSGEEMQLLFKDVPEALENTLAIASRCNVDMQFGNYQMPDFRPPIRKGVDEVPNLELYLRHQSNEGLDKRWPLIVQGIPEAKREDYNQRMQFELDTIIDMGFAGYFLIVADFIQWAKNQDIPVGPGRGSGAGSLVAYSLGITDLDPLRYGLLFERFLNPERVSMPDFDIDFCMNRRDAVIQYVTKKYGTDKVAQIITFGSMKAKAVVRDVARALGMPPSRGDMLAKLIPNNLNITLDTAFAQEDKLLKECNQDNDVARLFMIARRLEGLHRHAGKHAAGVIIGRQALQEIAPLYRDSRDEDGGAIVQWDMKCSEKVGLIKFDFLGLKTLTVLHLACSLAKKYEQLDLGNQGDLLALPLDDVASFALLQRGDTKAVFQLESSGIRELLVRLRPDCFEDIIALVALYRPGPLQSGMVDTFIDCKHGRQEVEYPLPQLKPILAETYGVILYQEQVMKIAQVLALYSLGQADMLRRAMGKKNPEEMAKQRQVFMEGSSKNNIPEDKATYIFDLMEKFAGYGFNKSHSAAYALIAYQTAYLKAHAPRSFMAATMSCDMQDDSKIQSMVEDCRSSKIPLLPPNINSSVWGFVPEGEGIRFGLGAIKGVGEAAVTEVLAERDQGGSFVSLLDMLSRIKARTLNKRMLEAIIVVGATDCMGSHRAAVLENLEYLQETANRQRRERAAGQSSLFDDVDSSVSANDSELMADVAKWTPAECLRQEREALGFYLTGHPLAELLRNVYQLGDSNLGLLANKAKDAQMILPISVGSIRMHQGVRGKMAFVRIEDLHAGTDLVCFQKTYAKYAHLLQPDALLLLKARVDRSREEPSLIAEEACQLIDVLPQIVEYVVLIANATHFDAAAITSLEQLSKSYSGNTRLDIRLELPNGLIAYLKTPLSLCWNETVRSRLARDFAAGTIHVHCRALQDMPTVEAVPLTDAMERESTTPTGAQRHGNT